MKIEEHSAKLEDYFLTRRQFLHRAGMGFGALSLAALLGDEFFGQDVNIPPLKVTYNIQSVQGGGTEGRDQTHLLPPMPFRLFFAIIITGAECDKFNTLLNLQKHLISDYRCIPIATWEFH